ncbi:pilus assembly protein PilO [Sporosarcina sp. P12(2017)]|uniref:pilus assembly protein PilO n=1 Tax=unclassified Sporosarcina TaxID=2647733 RepID=UPI000C163AA4|nr:MULTISPECIES: pilus assembly protein PilO [unclassified Sporosarcina]PIC57877.1 pilus assembly protein PilO [Sporosarcina sp. P10]PIC61259.1 pilus assembly protein PilO [Sporosarcina sp. P12(2017)]
MSKYLSKRQMEIGLVVLVSIFLIALVYYTVTNVYLPAKETKDQMAAQFASERDVLFSLQKQLANKDPNETVTSAPLQKVVPVIPLEDALLIRLEKAEVKSNSRIEEINFSKEVFDVELLPENVQNLETVLMEVTLAADTYKQVDTFIYEIEEMIRIMNVETIQFEATAEKTEEESDIGEMKVVISFNAYFRPDLVNLQNEAPKVDAPPPALKFDPTTINKMTGTEKAE